MDVYFARMATMMNNKALSSRVRFMLKDVIDLRKDQWIPRRQEMKMASLEEIRQDVRRVPQGTEGRRGVPG